MITNEYIPAQGITSHIDKIDFFSNEICSLSLNSDILMDFEHGKNKIPQILNRRSLCLLFGEARYKWKHGIAPRKSDLIGE